MMKYIFTILTIFILTIPNISYSSEIKSYIGCDVHIYSYNNKNEDLFLLKLQNSDMFIGLGKKLDDSEKIIKIKQKTKKLYKEIIVKNNKNYNIYDKYQKVFSKVLSETHDYIYSLAQTESKITEEIGDGWSTIDIIIKVKGTRFPVLYEVSLKQGINSLITSEKTRDIGYSTPENIDSEILKTVEQVCNQFIKNNEAWAEMKKEIQNSY